MQKRIIFWILLAIILLVILFLALLQTRTIGFAWRREPDIRKVSVESFDPTKEIYASNERAYVLFTIKNTLGIPYNVTVTWFNNQKVYFSWFNRSVEQYNVTEIINPYESWIDLNGITGDWDVTLIVEYTLNNLNLREEHTRRFVVI